MLYKELCRRLTIEKLNSPKYLRGRADKSDIDIFIKDTSDENTYSIIVINGVQMRFRRLQLGMQEPSDDAWLIISGFHDEKCVRICDIKDLYFNHYKWETIHG